MKLRVALFILISGLLSAAFMNCSQDPLTKAFSNLNSTGTPSPTPNPNPQSIEYETADMAGNIRAYQDLQFRFKVPGAGGGATLVGTNLPAWISVDSANGEISGVPLDIASHPNVRIQIVSNGQTTTAGPYTIQVTGDPMKRMQWHLRNTGVSVFSATAPRSGEDIHMGETVRTRVLGQNIKVAVSDTGIQQNHRGLSPNIMAGASRNYLNNFQVTNSWLGDSSPADTAPGDAHGTAVAGLIGERGWLGQGGRGVAPLARLAGFLFIPALSQLIVNNLLTVAHNDQFDGDFDIFNYSWGDVQCALIEYPQSLKDKMKAGATNLRGGKGAIYVKAAGNEFVGAASDCFDGVNPQAYVLGNANFSEEGVSPYLIAVGAINANGTASSYSTPGANVWVSAPGGEYGWNVSPNNSARELEPAIVATDFAGCEKGIKTFSAGRNAFDDGSAPNAACDHTATMNGTSSASPITAGAIALMLSVNPNLSWRDVKHILAVTADRVDPNSPNTNHPAGGANQPAGHVYQHGWVTNAAGVAFHNRYGFGRIHVDRAVAMARGYVSQLGTFRETNTGATYKYDSGALNLAVPGGGIAGISRTLTVTENYRIEGVMIRADILNCVGALGLELTSPSGTKSIIMNVNSQLLDTQIMGHEFLSNAFYNENSAGVWTLKVINPRANCNATWNNWQINIFGH